MDQLFEPAVVQGDMVFYDHLDPTIRDFLRQMPIMQKDICQKLFFMQKQYGAEQTLSFLHTRVKQIFPDWTPI